MPKRKQHPETLEKATAIPDRQRAKQERLRDFVASLKQQVEDAETDRATWEENLTRWFKKRYGVRPATKNFPWPNASNVHVSLTEEKIRRLKPNYINLAFEGDPIVAMYPVGDVPMTAAQDAELLMHWLLIYYMNQVPGKNYLEALTISVDRMLEKSFAFVKPIWEYITRSYTKTIDVEEDLPPDLKEFVLNPETQDEDLEAWLASEVEYDLEDEEYAKRVKKAIADFRADGRYIDILVDMEVYNGPRVVPVAPEELIVPPDTTDVEDARLICHRMWMTANELKVGEKVGKYKNVDEILDLESAKRDAPKVRSTTLKTTKATREGVTEFLHKSHLIEIWEVYTWYDINDDGVEEKVVITFHPASGIVLRAIEFPYEHWRWPFIPLLYELTDERWYSPRGVPELLDHYQTIATNQENAKLDYMTMANSLQFKYRLGSMGSGSIRWIPGQGVGVQRMEDLEQLRVDRIDISFDNEMTKIRGLSEQLIGQPDLALNSISNPQERRTAFEISEVVSLSKQVFSLDARLFKNSLQKLYYQIFALWMQYGPEEVWVNVTGGPPVKISKEQINHAFVLVPNGEFTLLSRTLEQQRAGRLLDAAISDTSGAINTYKAWENYLLKTDPRAAKRILNDEQTYQRIQQFRMQQAELEFQKKLQVAGRPTTGSPSVSTGGGG
jgi:hypothetical protein